VTRSGASTQGAGGSQRTWPGTVRVGTGRLASETSGTPRVVLLLGLLDVLRSERRLLEAAAGVLVRQRGALLASAADEISDCTYAAQRVLLTLGEARKWRRLIAERLGAAGLPVPCLPARLGLPPDDEVTVAVREVEVAARRLADDVTENRRTLRLVAASAE
jgi:hypothetical protein